MPAWRNPRVSRGYRRGLVARSVGIEDAGDLVADISAALERAKKARPRCGAPR